MDFLQFIILIAINVLSILIVAYAKKKGENLATKEDIQEITRRIEEVKSEFTFGLELFRNEYTIAKTTYEKFIEKILSYYSIIYSFYLKCQDLANHTKTEYPGGKIIDSRTVYLDSLDNFIEKYNEYRGYIRLLLPKEIKEADENLLEAFNNFRDQVLSKDFNPSTETKLGKQLYEKKNVMENLLRNFLRTDLMFENEIKSQVIS